MFLTFGDISVHIKVFSFLQRVSSSDQGHEVDAFGIGTYLVTCYAQAALGCVFKLVEINNQPRIKLSEDVSKVWSNAAVGAAVAFWIVIYVCLFWS